MLKIISKMAVAALLVIAVSAGAQGNGSKAGSKATCRRVGLTHKPGWVLSGGFTSDGSTLLVVDALNRTILKYTVGGESQGPIDEPLKSFLAGQLPSNGRFQNGNFIVEVTDGLMALDKNLRPSGTKRLVPRQEVLTANRPEWRIGGYWQWEPVGQTDFVAFVDMVKDDATDLKNWKTGFVRFSLGRPEIEVLDEFELTGTANKGYFRTGYQYIAAIGDTAYYLSMNQGVRLYKSEKGQRQKDVSFLLPPGLRSARLPDWNAIDEYVLMMKSIERESLPVGLYGWNQNLYLIYREPHGRGTRWLLYRLDPTGAKPYEVTELPIQGAHATVIPGRQQWAVLEKGPVLAFGAQNIPRMLLIPANLLKAPLASSDSLCP